MRIGGRQGWALGVSKGMQEQAGEHSQRVRPENFIRTISRAQPSLWHMDIQYLFPGQRNDGWTHGFART